MHSILEKGYDLSSSLPVSFQKKKKMPLFLSEVATALKNNKNPALAYLWILMNIYSLCYSGLSPPPPPVRSLGSLDDLWNHPSNILSLWLCLCMLFEAQTKWSHSL